MTRLAAAVAVTIALLFSLRGAAAQDNAGEPSESAVIRAIVEEAMQARFAVGLSVAVARGEDFLLNDGFGLADLEHDVPADERTIFRIASLTKQFTAAMILRLIEDGRLSLDDDITAYVDYPSGEHTVTIHHLLNHTSGIPSYTGVSRFWREGSPRELSHDDLLAFVKDQPFDFAPGERFRYNNTGYYLLGMVIEKVTGKSYAEALQEMIVGPLGLEYTRYDSNREIIPNRARGYGVQRGRIVNAQHLATSNPGGAGGIVSTAADLVRWQRALAGGRLICAESYATMTTPTEFDDGSTHNYGYGLVINEHDGRRLIGHAGGINGFSTSLLYFPDDDLHIAVLSNCEALPAEPIGFRIAEALLQASNSEEARNAHEAHEAHEARETKD